MHRYRNLFILFSIFLTFAQLSGCVGKRTPQAVQYAEDESIPYRIAILPAEYVKHDSNSTEHKSVLIMDDDRKFVADISRAAIANQLAGKGFLPQQKDVVDTTLNGLDKDWKELSDEELCRILQSDGVVRIDIYSADMLKAIAFDLFQLDAEVRMSNKSGMQVGKWRDSASKRRVSVPTGVFALAGTIVEEVFSDPIRRQMRMVIYDWAWNMAQMLPDCPVGTKLPEVIAVDTNVDNRLFGAGQRITVRVDAEPGLHCSFSIGEFKKDIPLQQTSQGVYEGFYVIKEGDRSSQAPLSLRMRKPNGVERLWIESGSLISIDGILPTSPEGLKFRTGREGVILKWQVPEEAGLEKFIVEKSNNPIGGYEPVAQTMESTYLDIDVLQGSTVFYRIRSVDNAGNLSKENGHLKVVMPQFDERELPARLSGTLVKGNYLLPAPATIPEGTIFTVKPGTKIRFMPGAYINVFGEFESLGEISGPVRFMSNSSAGIFVLPGGKAVISNSEFSGFSNSVTDAGGYCEIRSSVFSGGETALRVKSGGNYEFKGLRITDSGTGMLLEAGNGTVLRSSISNSTTGIKFNGGKAEIKQNNIFDNNINVISSQKLVITDNYLGTASAENMRVQGDVLVKAILDAPYPHGRRIVLVDERTITPEVLEKQFNELKKKGVSSFHSQHYGDAYQALNKAVKLKDDRDVYLYLSYTLLALSDDIALTEILTEGISRFPYDVRLHQLYIRHLINQGDLKQAREVLEKALLLSPADSNLLYMKDYLDQLGK